MINKGSENATMRLASGGRLGGPLVASQRNQAVRMNLFVLVRILFQYLERVDGTLLDLAKEVLKDCERKHKTKDSKYETLADAIGERVRDAVGEAHWLQARKIQKQLAVNQQNKKLKAMRAQMQQKQQKQQSQQKVTFEQSQRPIEDETMEAACAMSALSQASPLVALSTNSNNLSTASSKCVYQEMKDGGGDAFINNVPVRNPQLGKQSLPMNEKASSPRDAAVAASSGQLPLRKRIMFGSLPPSAS